MDQPGFSHVAFASYIFYPIWCGVCGGGVCGGGGGGVCGGGV